MSQMVEEGEGHLLIRLESVECKGEKPALEVIVGRDNKNYSGIDRDLGGDGSLGRAGGLRRGP